MAEEKIPRRKEAKPREAKAAASAPMRKKNLADILLAVFLLLFSVSFAVSLPYIKSSFLKTAMKGPVKVAQDGSGWRLTVGGEPFFVKGVCYQYVPTGKGEGYDIFDDAKKPWVVDGALMKAMGVNAVRFYKPGKDTGRTKSVIRHLFDNCGIKTALGHYLGYWDWPPPNYADPALREKLRGEVMEMVRNYKDEDGILFWVLGNENNYSFDRGERDWSSPEIDALQSPLEVRNAKARVYYTFINDLAKEIKTIDPNHPVAMGNGELASINIAKEHCPDVDILGGIIYQGKSFGTYFDRLKRNFGKPNCFIEFGADSYDTLWQQESQDWQAFFLKLQWLEITKNGAGGQGAGNSLGGFVFEWCDEWWKHNSGYEPGWRTHDIEGSWSNTAYYYDAKAANNMNEEWWGVVGLDPKSAKYGFEGRAPRKAYYVLKELWTPKGNNVSGAAFILAVIFLITMAALLIAREREKSSRKSGVR